MNPTDVLGLIIMLVSSQSVVQMIYKDARQLSERTKSVCLTVSIIFLGISVAMITIPPAMTLLLR